MQENALRGDRLILWLLLILDHCDNWRPFVPLFRPSAGLSGPRDFGAAIIKRHHGYLTGLACRPI
jgi:hypothetical protein